MMNSPLILVPAYGRQYATKEDAFADYFEGKDFRILSGPYTSVRDYDLLVMDFGRVFIRWGPGQYDEVTASDFEKRLSH